MGERAMKRIFYLLTAILVSYFVQSLIQDNPKLMAMDLEKAIRVGLDGEIEKRQDWPVTRVLGERNPKGFIQGKAGD